LGKNKQAFASEYYRSREKVLGKLWYAHE